MLYNIQIQNKPSSKRLQGVEITRNMDVIVARCIKCMIENTVQYIFTKGPAYFDITTQGATVYVGDTSIDDYSGGVSVHFDGDW